MKSVTLTWAKPDLGDHDAPISSYLVGAASRQVIVLGYVMQVGVVGVSDGGTGPVEQQAGGALVR